MTRAGDHSYVIGLAIFLALGCSDSAADTPNTAVLAQADLQWGPAFTAEETEQTINVTPMVTIDPMGGFLVADASEAQLRRYDLEGNLLWSAGRKGQGPGEYLSPRSILRLADDRIVVLDNRGRVTLLDEEGQYQDSFEMSFRRLEGAVALSDRILVFGVWPEAGDSMPLLHVLNLSTRTIEDSFFPRPLTQSARASRLMAYAQADVYADTIAVAFAALDSVYMYTADGRRHRAFRMPLGNFRLAEDPPADFSNPVKRTEWGATFESVGGLWWLGPDRLAVAYKTLAKEGFRWHWAIMTDTGELLAQQLDSGRLLDVNAKTGTVLTIAPESELPNSWQEFTVRP